MNIVIHCMQENDAEAVRYLSAQLAIPFRLQIVSTTLKNYSFRQSYCIRCNR